MRETFSEDGRGLEPSSQSLIQSGKSRGEVCFSGHGTAGREAFSEDSRGLESSPQSPVQSGKPGGEVCFSGLCTAGTETFSEDSLPNFKGLEDLPSEFVFFATGTEEAAELDSE